jgi:hypothetical protein
VNNIEKNGMIDMDSSGSGCRPTEALVNSVMGSSHFINCWKSIEYMRNFSFSETPWSLL